ncbi:hypothetical protein AMECASPLE_033912 [Ameca splendens]|uniref:Uncharacterized protein n=1 Tax=Ameca splendens TaxID=208324 RepID=A0ABV0Z5T8_9TELE
MEGFSLHLKDEHAISSSQSEQTPAFLLPLITNSAHFFSSVSVPSKHPQSLDNWVTDDGYMKCFVTLCIPNQHKLWLRTLETRSSSQAHASHSSNTLSPCRWCV